MYHLHIVKYGSAHIGSRFWLSDMMTIRLKNSFFPWAIKTLNAACTWLRISNIKCFIFLSYKFYVYVFFLNVFLNCSQIKHSNLVVLCRVTIKAFHSSPFHSWKIWWCSREMQRLSYVMCNTFLYPSYSLFQKHGQNLTSLLQSFSSGNEPEPKK